MRISPISFWRLAIFICFVSVAACGAYQPTPTPSVSPTVPSLVIPPTLVGTLKTISIETLSLTMLAPSDWKPPTALNDNSVVLSPDGSTDTSPTAGPFLFIVVGNAEYFHNHLSFRQGLTDPVAQLTAMIAGMNLNEPEVGDVTAYTGAKYPAAIVQIFARGNKQTIALLSAGNDRWIYVGAQAKESYFPYYENAVFQPATDSIVLK